MSLIPLSSGADRTMSSLAIAEITGKRHDNVIRDIRVILVELHGEGGLLKFEDTHTNPQNNQSYSIFQLPERELLILLSGYSVTLRAKVIDRWQELERAAAPSVPEMLRLAAAAIEENEALKLTVAEQAPKVEFYDAVTESSAVCQMAVACQVAQLPFGRNILYQKLRQLGVLISGGERHNLPKQLYIKQGLFTVKEKTIPKPDSDEPIISFTTHVTQKGIDWLVKTFSHQGGQPA